MPAQVEPTPRAAQISRGGAPPRSEFAFRGSLPEGHHASCNERLTWAPGAPRFRVGTIHALSDGMKDLLFVAITVGFFALSWLYVRAAEKL